MVGFITNFTEANPGSGVHPNQWGVTSQIQVGADLDLEQAIHWKGAKLQVRQSFFIPKYNAVLHFGSAPPATESGHFWDQDVGSTLVGTTFQDFAPIAYLSQLTLEQTFTKPLKVQVGRMSPTSEFDQPANCETLLSCLDPITIYDNRTMPPALATWGALATYTPTAEDSVRVGVTQVDFSQLETSGFQWSFRRGTGSFLAGEYTHRTASKGESLALGFWHDTSRFTDPVTFVPQAGSSAVYARFSSRVGSETAAADSAFRPQKYLELFSTASYSLSSAQPFQAFLNAGFNVHGVQAHREQDHYGLNVAYLRVRPNEITSEQQVRRQLSGTSFRSSSNQFRVEGNAHLAWSRWAAVEPSIAYIIHPNVQFATFSASYGSPRDGIVLGFVTLIDLHALWR